MLDAWDEVLSLNKERQRCADDLEKIKAACARDHAKQNVSQCPECWDRRLFLQELDTMFSKARAGSLDFKIIEQRIHDEKKEWYRDKVRNMGLHSATKSPSEAKLLQQKLDDREMLTEELASELRGAISDNALPDEAAFDNFLNRLKDAETTQARNDIYIDTLFQPRQDPEKAAMYQSYMEMIRGGVAIQFVVDVMLRDRRWAQSKEEQKQRLQGKLEELKRAKAAHELSVAKKQKARQDKAAAAAASDSQHDLPPCSVCSKALDAQDFLACPLCHLLGEQYGLGNGPVLYCSETCHEDDYESHRKSAHNCAAGQTCINLHDADVEMDEARRIPVFCRDYGVHIPERKKARAEVDDEGQLEYASEDKTQYRARKIEEHLITLSDAVEEYQQRTGATVS
ncbi:hypothetical protein DL764_007841 [Monosporascus ibericus]|uniref:MYND-type domain-containing protein n=1 Tax=Monosporascus ibericus TaxID=155417 RepID=A0A4Q4T176_9PEZI|nr:hypothetical protein DL764_007841 [Monosporascus ibericus]